MRTKQLLFATVLLSLFISCAKDEDEKCGPSVDFDYYSPNNSLFSDFGNILTTYMEGSNRVFQWSDIVEHVCADEHVKVNYRVPIYTATAQVSARGRIDWNFFFEQKIEMLRNNLDFKGNGEAGLKGSFGDGEAWFVPVVEVFFPTRGSYAADSAFLQDNVVAVEMKASYKAFKQ